MPRPKGAKNKKTSVGLMDDLKGTASSTTIRMPSVSVPSFSASGLQSRANAWRKDRRFMTFLATVLLVGLAAALFYYKKHWVVVALVNNRPVTSVELVARMFQTYRKEMTEQMVNERVVFNEARKQGAMPSQAEVNDKITEIEERYGGKDEFAKLLLENGQSRANLEMNVRTLLAMEKMYGEMVTVSDEDIETYLKENTVEAADEASRREEARKAVREQKLNQLYSQKFQELKSAANIRVF